MVGQQISLSLGDPDKGVRSEASCTCTCGRLLRWRFSKYGDLEWLLEAGPWQTTCKGCRTIWLITVASHSGEPVVADAFDCGVLA